MLATAFSQAKRQRLLAGWVLFVALNVSLMYALPGEDTIPFHFVWISYALVYGLRPWRLLVMWLTLAVITSVTGLALLLHANAGYIGYEETAEVPLMAGLFLVMVWHVRRRQVALQEVSRLAAVERRRTEAQQLFVRLASHELRTPITVARGYTELIRASRPDAATDDDAGIVLDELAKLERITARLLTLMQAESEQPVNAVDLDVLLERVVRRWSPTAVRTWRLDSTAGMALINVERLETALDCLFENAVKFTGCDDVIELRSWKEAGEIFLELRDTGMGIAPDDLPLVFDNFVTGRDIGSRAGTGLGLAIVRAFAQARGGSVSVRSTLGAGTTFLLTIPERVPDRPAPANSHATPVDTTTAGA